MKVSFTVYLFGLGLLFPVARTHAQSALDTRLDTLLSYTIPLIQEDELSKLLSKKSIILLDTRTQAEYDVSHIKGAKFIDYNSFTPEMVSELKKNKPIVVYCSVGYRSEKIGERLKELGFTNVQNLYGGVFEWKNNGHMVVDSKGMPTDSVHAYNIDWGQYLKKGVKVQ